MPHQHNIPQKNVQTAADKSKRRSDIYNNKKIRLPKNEYALFYFYSPAPAPAAPGNHLSSGVHLSLCRSFQSKA